MDLSMPISEAIASLKTGEMSRRDFIIRLTAAGFSMSVIGTLLAAAGASASSSSAGRLGAQTYDQTAGPWADDPKSLSGTVKIYKGPFAANELDLQKPFIERFNQTVPGVTVDFSLYDWTQ